MSAESSGSPAVPPDTAHLDQLLSAVPPAVLDVPRSAWGFGGLHGGLALSLVASSMRSRAADQQLRSITAQFHRPIRETFAIDSQVIRLGRSAGAVQATGSGPDGLCLTASAIFGADQPGLPPSCAPEPPDVPQPQSVESVDTVDLHVPVLAEVDVRPIGSIRPYAQGAEPVMTAWMRVRGTDAPLAPHGLVFFLDALPPSYTAVLAEHRPVPTLELSAHLTANRPASSWVLVRSRTVRATDGGWVTELVDLWDTEGVHLACAQQLRLAAAVRSPE